MGALDEGHFSVELEDGVNLEVGCEGETLAIEEAVKVLLQGLGEDSNREGLRKTPARVAKALREGTRGYRQKAKDIVQDALFPEAGLDNGVGRAGGAGGLVIVRDLDLFSYCESCLLPFQFKCHVGYVPSGQRVVGLSKLSRVADVYAKRLQEPQRLADEICSALHQGIKPAGVALVLQCAHIHFPSLELSFLDSNHQGSVKVLVYSGKGLFENANAAIWSDFLSLLKFQGINVEKTCSSKDSTGTYWCPSQSSSAGIPYKIEAVPHRMVSAVTSILRSLGEDPLRKELVGTPNRYVKWLMQFEKANLELKKLDGYVRGAGSGNCNEEEMQCELNMPFWSQCEHHLLPFHGVVHIGYLHAKGTNPISKSLLQSIVHFYGFKLQVQERLTRQIAESVSSVLGGNVMVVVEAFHSCMVSRGIEKLASSTATMALLGRFSNDDAAKTKFLHSITQSTSTR